MNKVESATYQGQPVYRQQNDGRTCYFSREVKALPGGGWKFVRWLPIAEADIQHGSLNPG